jgi:hypothetical protein
MRASTETFISDDFPFILCQLRQAQYIEPFVKFRKVCFFFVVRTCVRVRRHGRWNEALVDFVTTQTKVREKVCSRICVCVSSIDTCVARGHVCVCACAFTNSASFIEIEADVKIGDIHLVFSDVGEINHPGNEGVQRAL